MAVNWANIFEIEQSLNSVAKAIAAYGVPEVDAAELAALLIEKLWVQSTKTMAIESLTGLALNRAHLAALTWFRKKELARRFL